MKFIYSCKLLNEKKKKVRVSCSNYIEATRYKQKFNSQFTIQVDIFILKP